MHRLLTDEEDNLDTRRPGRESESYGKAAYEEMGVDRGMSRRFVVTSVMPFVGRAATVLNLRTLVSAVATGSG